MRIRTFLACSLLVVSPALARKEGVEATAAADPNKVVCKTEDVIGSRLQSEKHCMTVAQWAQLQRETYNSMDRIQGRSGDKQSASGR